MTEEEIGQLNEGETVYAAGSSGVKVLKFLLQRNGDPVLEDDSGELVWFGATGIYTNRLEALLAFAADRRKSANQYRKTAEENHAKAVEQEALAAEALAAVQRSLNSKV